MTGETKTLFLVGVGYIGGSILHRLLEQRKDIKVTALTRSDEQARVLESLGVAPLRGTLDDVDIIKQAAATHDIVIHAATADHEPSASAIADGIASRPSKAKKAIYIHTSGTGVLVDDAKGTRPQPPSYTFYDFKPEDIDARLADDAPHRPIDLALKRKLMSPEKEKEHNARAQIVLPCLIYGLGSGPFNNISIQAPALMRASITAGHGVVVGEGKNLWNAVHIEDLVTGYLLLLQELEKSEPGAAGGPYTFAETEVFEWRKLSEQIAASLKKRGKGDGTVKTATKDELDQFLFGEEAAYATFGGNSLASADRLRALGWQTGSGRLSLLDSIEKEEVDDMLKRLGMERRRVVA